VDCRLRVAPLQGAENNFALEFYKHFVPNGTQDRIGLLSGESAIQAQRGQRKFGVRRLVGAISTPRGLPARGPRKKAVTSHRTPKVTNS
jgi:hypothetical protein